MSAEGVLFQLPPLEGFPVDPFGCPFRGPRGLFPVGRLVPSMGLSFGALLLIIFFQIIFVILLGGKNLSSATGVLMRHPALGSEALVETSTMLAVSESKLL